MAKSELVSILGQVHTDDSFSLKREHWVITNEYMDAVKVCSLDFAYDGD